MNLSLSSTADGVDEEVDAKADDRDRHDEPEEHSAFEPYQPEDSLVDDGRHGETGAHLHRCPIGPQQRPDDDENQNDRTEDERHGLFDLLIEREVDIDSDAQRRVELLLAA